MKKILIVDDSSFMRGILKDLLTNNDLTPVEIFEADSGSGALKQLKNVQPDLVFLDIVMRASEYEGVEVLKKIKQSYSSTNVIIITSVGQTAVIEQCKKLGAKEYIQKPFNQDDILQKVNKYLA